MKNFCLAGGVALNCVANGKVLRDARFRNIWIQPAAGDAGGALGAALAAITFTSNGRAQSPMASTACRAPISGRLSASRRLTVDLSRSARNSKPKAGTQCLT